MNFPSDEEHIERAKAEIRAAAVRLEEREKLLRRAPPARTPMASGVDGIEPARLRYAIGELTDLHHRAFVDHAFRTLLKRPASADEIAVQLALLASGAPKSELLGNLRWSPEGRRISAQVDGLLPRYLAAKLKRVPVLGYFFDWALSLAGLPLLIRHQRATEALFTAADAAAVDADRALAARVNHVDVATRSHLEELDRAVAHLREWTGGLQTSIQDLADAHVAMRERMTHAEHVGELQRARLDELDFLRQRLYALNHWMHHLNVAFEQIEAAAAARRGEVDKQTAPAALALASADADRDARLSDWLAQLASTLGAGARVLALACDGDWLGRLAARGFRVAAAEPNEALADAARKSGVPVDLASGADALRRCADRSLDSLTVLSVPALLRDVSVFDFCTEAARAMKADARLLLAWAQEPPMLAGALTARTASEPIDPDLLGRMLGELGFAGLRRVDAAGTPALLAVRKAD